jgi:hypothetical protein
MTGRAPAIPARRSIIETIPLTASPACRGGGLAQPREGPAAEKEADFLGRELDEYLPRLAGEWHEGQSLPPGCLPRHGGTSGCSTA